jgi:predicted transcriptional regulator
LEIAMSEDALALTARIVSAQVSNNSTAPAELIGLIASVYDALTKAGQPSEEPKTKEPAVPVKKSVFNDHIVCLECGKGFKILKRHLQADHHLTTDEYRTRFALPHDYPMVAPEYAEKRSTLAKKIGLGRSRTTQKRGRKRA